MFASLPMYDFPEHRDHTDRLWSLTAAGLRARGIEAPKSLSRPYDLPADWLRPDLLLSQTCGLPFARSLRGRVSIVGAVDHGLPDCPPGSYRSRVVVRADDPARSLADLRGRTVAINNDDSQSGQGAFRMTLAAHGENGPFFARVVETGAHLESIRAVARGEADVAAIDAVTHALALRHLPEARTLRVLLSTPPTPGLPFITRLGGPAAQIRDALAEAIDAIGPESRSVLMLHGLVPRSEEEFDGIAAADRESPPLAGS